MAKRVLSIEIGDKHTKVCELSYRKNNKKKRNRVYRSISFPTPLGSVEDGFIKQAKVFSGELAIRIRDGGFQSNQVIFTMCSNRIMSREVILPEVKRNQTIEELQTGNSEYFPIDQENYILSYNILERISLSRQEKVLQKKQVKTEKKLARAKENKQKALKRRSRTELIADYLEQLQVSHQGEAQIADEALSHSEGTNLLQAKRYVRCALYAAPIALVSDYYSLAKRMHLDVLGIDCYMNSSFQAMKRQSKKGIRVFVQMNEEDSSISILRHNILLYQKTVEYGLSRLLEAVSTQEYYSINSSKEALELICNSNLLTTASVKAPSLQLDSSWSPGELAAATEVIQSMEKREQDGPIKHQNEQNAMKNVRDSLHVLTHSLLDILDNYISNHKNIEVKTIYLTGKAPKIQGIEEFFRSELGIKTKNLKKLRSFRPKRKAREYRSNPSDFLTCVGAVVKPIGFVPAEFIIQKRNWRAALMATLITLLCLGASTGIIYSSYQDYLTAKQELDQWRTQYEAMPKLSGVHEEYEKELSELQDLEHLEAMTTSYNRYIKDIIDELETKLPSDTITNSIVFSDTGMDLDITFKDPKVGANAIIAQTLKQLKSIPYFEGGVKILESSIKDDKGIRSINLSLSCLY